jgi:hypothetical protein
MQHKYTLADEFMVPLDLRVRTDLGTARRLREQMLGLLPNLVLHVVNVDTIEHNTFHRAGKGGNYYDK